MKITLEDKQKRQFEIDVEQELIAEASMIIYRGVYYTYSRMQGNLLNPVFHEVNAPVFVG